MTSTSMAERSAILRMGAREEAESFHTEPSGSVTRDPDPPRGVTPLLAALATTEPRIAAGSSMISNHAFLLILPALPALALAQEPASAPSSQAADRGGVAKPERLEGTVVTATRRDEKVFDVPQTAYVLDGDDLKFRKLTRNLNESLVGVPGVMNQRTSLGLGSPFLRGFGGYNTLLLVDGIRINSSVQRSGPSLWQNTVDPFMAERVEVVMGPGSVLYGTDAVGGTINVISKRRTSFEEGLHASASSFSRFETASKSWIHRGEISGNVDDRIGFFVGMTQKDFGDLRAGGLTGLQEQTGYSETDADGHFELRLSDEWRLHLVYQRVDQDDLPRTSQTKSADSFFGTAVGTDLKRDEGFRRDLAYVRAERRESGTSVNSDQFTVYWSGLEQTLNRLRTPTRREFSGADSDTLGASYQMVRESSAGVWTAGVDYAHDFIQSFKRNFQTGVATTVDVQGPSGDNAGADYAAAFAQLQAPVGKLELTPGLRVSYNRAFAGQVDNPEVAGALVTTPNNIIDFDRTWTELTGSFRALYRANEDLNFYAGISEAFRAPTVGDLSEFQTNSVVSLPDTQLDPERYLQEEIGFKARGDQWFLQGAYWLTQIDGSIVTTPTGELIGGVPVVDKSNEGDGYVNGIDLQGSWRFHPNLTAFASASWMEGYVDEVLLPSGGVERNPLTRGMPLNGVAGLRVSTEDGRFWAEGWVRASQKQDKLSNRDKTDTLRIPPGGTPGFFVTNFRAGAEVCPNASLSFAVENITNENYRIHGSGLNEAGTNFVLALSIRF